MQEVAKICYFMRDYEGAYAYYDRFMKAREAYNLQIYMSELPKIAFVYKQNGEEERAEALMSSYQVFAEGDQSIYGDLTRCMNHAYHKDLDAALASFRSFVDQEDFHYWTILFFPVDPIVEDLRKTSEFQELFSELESKFWRRHEALRSRLEKESLL